MKKALHIATVYCFFGFEESDFCILNELGYEVHLASNMIGYDTNKFARLGVINHQIDFARVPFSKQSVVAYKQLKKLIDETHFDIIHCHTPVAATIARLAARSSRKKGTKVIYTDHGFHFHKTSGIKSWILYYPIEFFMAFFTDTILTINKEDLGVIQNFHIKNKVYIPGVGVDVKRIMKMDVDRAAVRKEYSLPDDSFVILSVGELSIRKNHEVIIRALAEISFQDIYYIICGEGNRMEYLKTLSEELGNSNRVILAGSTPHDKVLELNHAADIAALPSLIEGLGLAGIEALAAGIPLVSSNVHGINDYVINGETGISCNPHDVDAFKNAIIRFYSDKVFYRHCCENAKTKAIEFDIDNVRPIMKGVYQSVHIDD